MDSASEGTGEASSRDNKPTWVIGLPKMGRIGTWQTSHDQGSLLQNPAHSTILRLRQTTVRNAETSRWFSGTTSQSRWSGRMPRELRWGKKQRLPCNAADRLTYPRWIG
jgi:hypothetical protein